MPTEHFLNNLIINKVDTAETYEAMKAAGKVNENEIYIIENPVADYIKEVNNGSAQKFWRGTKAEYDALEEKAEDTMYIVTDEEEINAATYMAMSVYDPQGKNTDIFAYVDNVIGAAISASY